KATFRFASLCPLVITVKPCPSQLVLINGPRWREDPRTVGQKGEWPVKREGSGYEWFTAGDINGFFGLMFDNVAVLAFFAGALIVGFNFPSDVVYFRMFPGTTFGVLCGDLLYTWMAFRL